MYYFTVEDIEVGEYEELVEPKKEYWNSLYTFQEERVSGTSANIRPIDGTSYAIKGEAGLR